jgi:hypothetical protein
MALPEVEVFRDANFGGGSWRTSLNYTYVGDDWNDSISSIVVYSGTWQFYEHGNYGGARSNPLGPGRYPWVEDPTVNMTNDTISSFQCIAG